MTELLTVTERGVLGMLGLVWLELADVVSKGPNRTNDLRELSVHMHALQNAVLAQAAARAYSGSFRLLGESLIKK